MTEDSSDSIDYSDEIDTMPADPLGQDPNYWHYSMRCRNCQYVEEYVVTRPRLGTLVGVSWEEFYRQRSVRLTEWNSCSNCGAFSLWDAVAMTNGFHS